MDLFGLRRPDHIVDPAWEAIEVARTRLVRAWELDDLPDVIGRSKELVETVAKVVVEATGGTVADSLDLAPTVGLAQQALKRQPGTDLSHDPNLRAMAQGAQKIVSALAPLRNTYGTGHGRARIPDVVEEMATISIEGAMLWSRWAMRRLGHYLADYPNDLVEAVQTGTSRTTLLKKFEAAALAQQPSDVQHRIGVVFGQQSAGGFGNATEVGVQPAINGGYDEYPIDYRRGLLEGMLLTAGGSIGLTDFYAPWFVSLAGSLPESDARDALEHLQTLAADAPWTTTWRRSTEVAPAQVVATLAAEGARLPSGLAEPFSALCHTLLETAPAEEA